MSVIGKLYEQKLIQCVDWLPSSIHYEVVMGSVAYGANLESKQSDTDVYGISVPPRDILFPYLTGKIFGFDVLESFETWQQHHILDKNKSLSFDLSVYNITKFFQLAYDCNPNIIDSLYVPQDCVRKLTTVGNLIRDNRNLFLSKLAFHKFRGYAFSQLNKIKVISDGNYEESLLDIYKMVDRSSRLDKVNMTVDWKFVYHVVRLILECQQILEEGNLDLRKHGAYLKSIRLGYLSLPELLEWFSEQSKILEKLHANSQLPPHPNRVEIREFLTECLKTVYNDLDKIVYIPKDKQEIALAEIRKILIEL